MRFKLDENIGIRGLRQLQQAGYDVMTVADEDLCGTPDCNLIDVCKKEERCLITFDVDFADVFTYPPENYNGIIFIKLPKRFLLQDIEDSFAAIISSLQKHSVIGKLWVVYKTKIREFNPGQE